METKGIPAEGSQVNVTNESVGNVQGVGSPSDYPWGAAEASPGGRADGPLEYVQEKAIGLTLGTRREAIFPG